MQGNNNVIFSLRLFPVKDFFVAVLSLISSHVEHDESTFVTVSRLYLVKPIPVSSCPCREITGLEVYLLFHDEMAEKNVFNYFGID